MTTARDIATTVDPAIQELEPVAQPLLTVGAPPRDLFYRYQWQGRDLPSWSSLRATAGVKPQLHAWALEGMATAALELGSTLARAVESGESATIRWAKDRLWDAAVEVQTGPARRGTALHELTAAGIPSPDVAPEFTASVRQYEDFLRVSRAEIVGCEFTVYNLTVGYGGTVDRLLRFPDGSVWLVDLKTGKSLWGESVLQVMAYTMAEFAASGPDLVDEELTKLLHEVRGCALLHVTEKGWEFRGLRADSDAWNAFRGLLTFAVWQHDNDSIDNYTVSIRKGGTR